MTYSWLSELVCNTGMLLSKRLYVVLRVSVICICVNICSVDLMHPESFVCFLIPYKQGLTLEDGAEHGDQRVLPDRLGARIYTRSPSAG